MSEPVDQLPEVSEAVGANGKGNSFEEVEDPGVGSGEESDEYEFEDEADRHFGGEEEEEEEGEDNGDGNNSRKAGLTALLLEDPNAAEEEEEEEAEDEDDEYVEGAPEPPTPSKKKRTIDEVVEDVDKDASEQSEAKKVKA